MQLGNSGQTGRHKMGSMFLTNEELGKKDDDHKPAKLPSIRPQWSAATGGAPRSKFLKRLAMAFALGAFVYLFISNLPTNVPIRDRRHPVYRDGSEAEKSHAPGTERRPGLMPKVHDQKPQQQAPPVLNNPPTEVVPAPAPYSGPLIFLKLLPSLQAIHTTGGTSPVNKNVLFAAANLKSAALLLPMACQMGDELRNYVHFALVGGSGISIEDLRAVNGIGESCQVIFHGMPSTCDGFMLG